MSKIESHLVDAKDAICPGYVVVLDCDLEVLFFGIVDYEMEFFVEYWVLIILDGRAPLRSTFSDLESHTNACPGFREGTSSKQ